MLRILIHLDGNRIIRENLFNMRVPVRSGGSASPIFLFHSTDGNRDDYPSCLLRQKNFNCPFHGNTEFPSLYVVMKHLTINMNRKICYEISGQLDPTNETDVLKASFGRISISGNKYGVELIW